MHDHGKRIPEDVSVVGFDNLAAYCESAPNPLGAGTNDSPGWYTYFSSYGYNYYQVGQTLQVVVTIGIAPTLHEPPTAADPAGDLQCCLALQRQQRASQTVTGFGLTFTADTRGQRGDVLVIASNDLHLKLI